MATNIEPVETEIQSARIIIQTDGTWRLTQLTDTLTAIDGLTARIGVAFHIAQLCQASDNMISHLRALGLLKKGRIDKWGAIQGMGDGYTRADYIDFVSQMRSFGVVVKQAPAGLAFSFSVPDLSEIAPLSSRAEIESIKMSSPGSISTVVSGLLGTKEVVGFLERIFDAIFFHRATKTKKDAEARQATAEAMLTEEKVKEARSNNQLAQINVRREHSKLIHDYSVAIDSLIVSLRNAGFDQQEIKSVLSKKITGDIDILSRYQSIGLIQGASILPLRTTTT